MRVFVAGATGAIGRPLVRRLAAGHEVVGMTISPARRTLVEADGGCPVVADALDADAVMRNPPSCCGSMAGSTRCSCSPREAGISQVFAQRNPDKLRRIAAQAQAAG